MKPSRLLFAELSRQELGAVAGEALAVLPIGATEQHGPHLPAGTDYFTVEHIAREAAAAAHIPVVVTPALPFGSSDHHFVFGATLSFSTATYYQVLKELVLSLVKDGFKRIFLVNGHGGNHELAQLAARDVAREHPVRVAAGSYWTIAWDALIAARAHEKCRLPGHAGIFETSMMMALRPDLIPERLPHRDGDVSSSARIASPYRDERHGFWASIDGFTDSPDRADSRLGQAWRDLIVAEVARAFVEFYSNEAP